jgi:broad specificity phosphatase PhoE
MTTLLLIRHGENEYLKHNKLPGRLPGIHLNAGGRQQAQEIRKTLGGLPIKAIYASPLERAVETAEPLAKALGLAIQIRPELIDAEVGEWVGRSWKTLRRTKFWKVIQERPSQFRFPGGESFVEIQERVVRSLDAIVCSHGDEMVAAFFHADPIMLAVTHYLGMPLDRFQRLTVQAGSVTILKVDENSVKLLALNLAPPFNINI